MNTTDGAAPCVHTLTLTDPDFYSLEIKVLEDLETLQGQQTIADVCRDRNIDQYDFKDRWGSLLRHNEASDVLHKIRAVKALLGNPIIDISKQLSLSVSTVRTIVKKLLVRPDSDHQRTKENLAHRMMASCGGSLKEAKAQLSTNKKRKGTSTEDESMESSEPGTESEDEDYGARARSRKPAPVKVEKVAGAKLKAEDPLEQRVVSVPVPVLKLEGGWFPTTLSMVDDIDPSLSSELQDFIAPKLQLKVLSELSDIIDLQQVCEKYNVDLSIMRKLWHTIISCFSQSQLDAYLLAVVTLHRLGYGYLVISDALSVPKSIVTATLVNLKLDLGATYGRSFDITVLLVKKEVMTSSRISEICGLPKDVGRQIIKRCGPKEQFVNRLKTSLDDVSTPSKIVWLYERGLNLQVICAVLKVPETVVFAAFPEDSCA